MKADVKGKACKTALLTQRLDLVEDGMERSSRARVARVPDPPQSSSTLDLLVHHIGAEDYKAATNYKCFVVQPHLECREGPMLFLCVW